MRMIRPQRPKKARCIKEKSKWNIDVNLINEIFSQAEVYSYDETTGKVTKVREAIDEQAN